MTGRCSCGGEYKDGGNPNHRVCSQCGERVHQAVAEHRQVLESLSKRSDKPGAYSRRLLETGGIA